MTTIATTLTAPFAPEENGHSPDVQARMQLLGLTIPARLDDREGGPLGRLRAVCPLRTLHWREAEAVAERQAGLLRRELGADERPLLSTRLLLELPFLNVTYRDGFPRSGMATQTPLGWVILIRGDEPQVRQRFSLAHELKHIIDDEHLAVLPQGLYPQTALYSAEERAEKVADRFAAALLMPRKLLRRDWSEGLQDVGVLARRYDVSRPAMAFRLVQLGLLEATPRCDAPRHQRRGEQ